MKQINDKYIAEKFTPQVNNAKPTNKKSTQQKILQFKDAVALPQHSLICILSKISTPNNSPNCSNSNSLQGTSNRTFKICLVTLSIPKNNNNAIAVVTAVNVLMKVINGIEIDVNKVTISPLKIKQPNLEVLKYIKDVKYLEVKFSKYIYVVREGKSIKGREYVRI